MIEIILIETVEVENIEGEMVVINKDDYDAKTHKLWKGESEGGKGEEKPKGRGKKSE